MQIRFANQFKKLFSEKVTVKRILAYTYAAQDQGWYLDTGEHTDGVSMDSDGITLHLVKFSDRKETAPDIDDFLLSADLALQSMAEERIAKREAGREDREKRAEELRNRMSNEE